MDLTRQHPGGKLYVRAVGADGITIAEEVYNVPLILAPDVVLADWPVRSVDDISEHTLQSVLELEPEVVLLGTGRKQRFLDPALAMVFHRNGVGFEVMDTRAACRTFNVLVMEERRVVAALIPPDSP